MKVHCEGIFIISEENTFEELRKKVLYSQNKAISSFYNMLGEKIQFEEEIINYEEFQYRVDSSRFQRYKTKNFRCRRCFKELKLTNYLCSHTSACRAETKLKYKSELYEIKEGKVVQDKNMDIDLEQTEKKKNLLTDEDDLKFIEEDDKDNEFKGFTEENPKEMSEDQLEKYPIDEEVDEDKFIKDIGKDAGDTEVIPEKIKIKFTKKLKRKRKEQFEIEEDPEEEIKPKKKKVTIIENEGIDTYVNSLCDYQENKRKNKILNNQNMLKKLNKFLGFK